MKGAAALAGRFEALAESIGLRREGLIGATLYRDIQFEIASRGLAPDDVLIARAAFNEAFEQRIVRQWPDHPRAELALRNLEKWDTSNS